MKVCILKQSSRVIAPVMLVFDPFVLVREKVADVGILHSSFP